MTYGDEIPRNLPCDTVDPTPLHTDLGTFGIGPATTSAFRHTHLFTSFCDTPCHSSHEHGDWITNQGQNRLWLPPEYRPSPLGCFGLDRHRLFLDQPWPSAALPVVPCCSGLLFSDKHLFWIPSDRHGQYRGDGLVLRSIISFIHFLVYLCLRKVASVCGYILSFVLILSRSFSPPC